MSDLWQPHLNVVHRILCYLHGTVLGAYFISPLIHFPSKGVQMQIGQDVHIDNDPPLASVYFSGHLLSLENSRNNLFFLNHRRSLASNPVFHECMEQIEVDVTSFDNMFSHGLLHYIVVTSQLQLADLFTNSLTTSQHAFLAGKLIFANLFSLI